MITVVALNPSIDRTLFLDQFHAGQTNRASAVQIDVGGKGINVCLHLSAMGANAVRCIGIMREADEKLFTSALQKSGVDCKWLMQPGHVRTNTKICTSAGELTEINERGDTVPAEITEQLIHMCRESFAESDVVILTGSVPPGVPARIYADLIAIAHESKALCILDADGEALRLSIPAKPDFIKPNAAEAGRLLNMPLENTADIYSAARLLIESGIPAGCISLGGNGAVYFSDEQTMFLPALEVPVRSTVGAGDAMIAAFALGMAQNTPPAETFRLAISAGAAAVISSGTQPVRTEDLMSLLKKVPQPTTKSILD